MVIFLFSLKVIIDARFCCPRFGIHRLDRLDRLVHRPVVCREDANTGAYCVRGLFGGDFVTSLVGRLWKDGGGAPFAGGDYRNLGVL